MRSIIATTLTASTLVAAAIGIPSSAQAQVVIIIGNGAAQPYYTQPYAYAQPYAYTPRTAVVYGGSYYPGYYSGYYPRYSYPVADYGYYNGNGYYDQSLWMRAR